MGWVNAAMLTGLLALGVPVAIHLLRSRRFQPADLGTLRFLKQAMRESARWRRLREWLLLLLRLVVVALLTLLFARPFVKDPNAAPEEQLEAALLIDVSGSMRAETLGVTNLELAREAALRVLGELPPEAASAVGMFADDVREVEDLLESKLHPGGRTDYAKALKWARDRLSRAPGKRKKVYLFTDLQGAGLPAGALEDWPLDVEVAIEPVTPPGAWNAAIAGVRNLSPFVGSQGALEVTLAAYGEEPDAEVELSLEIDGREPLLKTVPLRSGVFEFQWSPPAAALSDRSSTTALYQGVARIASLKGVAEPDAYPWDDRRHFAFQVSKPRPVLLVNGAPGETRFKDETYYLETALNLPPRQGAQSPFAARARSELGELGEFSVVALCNVAELRDFERARLVKHVRAGGGLIYFLGDRVRAPAYAALQKDGLFPAELALRRTPIPRQIIEWDAHHPAFALFDARDRGDLSRVIFREAFALELPETDDATSGTRTLARLGGGAPAILEGALGRGRIIVVANPCDRDWGDWPTERIFLPVARELFEYLTHAGEGPPPLVETLAGVDETRGLGLHPGDAGRPLTVVATDPLEADVRGADEAAFREALGLGAPPDEAALLAQAQDAAPLKRKRNNEIWWFLACGLLGVMFVENLLSDRGRS